MSTTSGPLLRVEFADGATRVEARETLWLGPTGQHFVYTVTLATEQFEDGRSEQIEIEWNDVHDSQHGGTSFPLPVGGINEFISLLQRIQAAHRQLLQIEVVSEL